jgi:hypothetical protein
MKAIHVGVFRVLQNSSDDFRHRPCVIDNQYPLACTHDSRPSRSPTAIASIVTTLAAVIIFELNL